jgi:hypothetical protein
MDLEVWLTVYMGIGAFVAAYSLYHGVLSLPRHRLFQREDQALLWITALAVGLLWVLFMPAAVAQLAIALRRVRADAGAAELPIPNAREARARL